MALPVLSITLATVGIIGQHEHKLFFIILGERGYKW